MDCLSLSHIKTWYEEETCRFPLALKGQEGLRHILLRTLEVDGMTFTLQHNPQRAVSTLAKVDKESISGRPCFLCKKNRDPLQASLRVSDRYEILVNPFPIFPFHLTIPDVSHKKQSIKGRLQDLLSLSRLLESCTVFYNGPQCGASAPDHMHFQAVGEDLTDSFQSSSGRLNDILVESGLSVKVENTKRHAFVIKSPDAKKVEQSALRLMEGLPIPEGQEEPMMNLLARYKNNEWTLILLGRNRHRPDCYFKDDDTRMAVSPASVDLAGCLVLPVRKDFERIKESDLMEILEEVCLCNAMTDRVVARFLKQQTISHIA